MNDHTTLPQAGRLRWYVRRLAAMSAQEIAHRVGEQARRRSSRWLPPRQRACDGPLPTLPGLAQALAKRAPGSLPLSAWKQVHEETVAGRFAALGLDWPAAGSDDGMAWHLDPVTERCWPHDRYCFAVPYRHTERFGDVKYVWERNRLQHLQAVAAHAAASGDAAAALLCRRQLSSWIGANPPYMGINWCSGIELALRVVSILVVTSLIGENAFSADERTALRQCLQAHGYWLARFPSRFSSANNHLVAEASALYLLGTLAPDLAGAAAWKRHGRATLEREIRVQIHPDGVGAEQSPTYLAFSLEWWMLADQVATRSGEPFSDGYRQAMVRAGSFLRALLDEGDNHPRIGDDDEGRVLAFCGSPDRYVPAVLEALAAATCRCDLQPNGSYPELWRLMVPEGRGRTFAGDGIRNFDDGGYWLTRQETPGGRLLLVFDHGPLGYLSIAAHGHADALAVWLHLDDQPVLVDAGTYLYHAGREWRDHFRSTAAHNTMAVEGASSSVTAGAFNWATKAMAERCSPETTTGDWSVAGEHDGYLRRFGVRHRRLLHGAGNGPIRIVDSLVGAERAFEVAIGFLIHPSLTVTADDDGAGAIIARGERPLLAIRHSGGLRCRLVRGETTPPQGWYSAGFGHLEPATRVLFEGTLASGAACVTELEILGRHP